MNPLDGKMNGLDGRGPDLVKNGSTATFVTDVITPSQTTPVLVDFWAEWCGPCKALGPTLEKIVREGGGSVLLVKIDVDQNQELAAQLGIQSIPTVIAFKGGRPVDAFTGALPEGDLKKFIARLGGAPQPSQTAEILALADTALQANDFTRAADIFSHVLSEEPTNLVALGGLARTHILSGNPDAAKHILATVPDDKKNDPAIVAVLSALEFSAKGVDDEKITNLKGQIEKDPKKFDTRYELAEALFATNEKDAAAEQLLYIIRTNRKWNDDAARKLLIKMFEAAGPKDPFTLEARRKLSSILYA